MTSSEVTQTQPLTVLVAPEIRAELEALAAEAERSLGGQARVALREHLAKAAEQEEGP